VAARTGDGLRNRLASREGAPRHTLPVVPNRLTGETAPNTLRGVNRPTSSSPASALSGGVVAAIPRVAAGWLSQRWRLALVVGAVVVFVVLLVLAPA
jgi:hypothetical protein